jgi:uncharacterized glyoxalase superfamily protein PhnB
MRIAAIATLVLLTAAFLWTMGPNLSAQPAAHDANAPVKPTQFSGVIPILNVKSVEKSIEYYTTVLGFEKHFDWPEDADKKFGSVTNGKVELFLCEGEQGSAGTWIYYNVADVDALHKQYQASKADIRRPPTDEPWAMREMLVRDIDGHVLRIGQSIPEEPATKPVE